MIINELERVRWWAKKRKLYNIGIALSGCISFLCYVVLGIMLIMPFDANFEITLFTIFFQLVGFILMMLIVNICFNLGYFIDHNFFKLNQERSRKRLFLIGFYFSILLPFCIPLSLIITYFFYYTK